MHRLWTVAFAMMLLLPAAIQATTTEPPEVAQAWIWSPDLGASGQEFLDVAYALDAIGTPWHAYEALGMVAFVGTPAMAQALHATHGGQLEPNQLLDLHLDRSVKAIEADVVSERIGTVRTGPSVLVIDTGVDSLHPDLNGPQLAANFAAERFGGLVVGVLPVDVVIDDAGHGTHVAGIIAGSGEGGGGADPLSGRFQGVYHNGRIVGFQALATDTEGDSAQVDTLAALEAMDWALKDGHQYDTKVVQASWGLGQAFDPDMAVNKATLKLYLDGILTVFSAGNKGDVPEALNTFCQAPWVLCVANVDESGSVFESSSRGASSPAAPYAHPDVSAPGTFITATKSVGHLDQGGAISGLASLQATSNFYEIRTGTSMAAPHVSGAAALLLAANPNLSPDQVMDILAETATPSIHTLDEVGVGMINVREAYNLAVQTNGNRAAFEAGQSVKYGGPAVGDDDYSDDPTSIGYDGTPTGTGAVLAPKNFGDQALDIIQVVAREIPLDWLIIGLAILLVPIFFALLIKRRRAKKRRKQARLQATQMTPVDDVAFRAR